MLRFTSLNNRKLGITEILTLINLGLFLILFATKSSQGYLGKILALQAHGKCYISADSFLVGVNDATLCTTNLGQGSWIPGVFDGAIWQVFTSAFVHFSLLHLGFNMLAILALGPAIENIFGRIKYLIIYFGSTLTGSLFVLLLSSYSSITFGASGALFGLMGAVLVFCLCNKQDYREILVWLLINFLITVVGVGNISWQGHLGGFIGGCVITWLLLNVNIPARHKPQSFQPPKDSHYRGSWDS